MFPIHMTRRGFLAGCATALLAPAPVRRLHAHCTEARDGHPVAGPHPTPRPGIDASKVVAAADLADTPEALPAFDAARRIPQILDGIRCHCGCAEREGFYSLLSCFEGDGMGRMCLVCQGQARLADRLERSGRSLDEIRAAIDARYG